MSDISNRIEQTPIQSKELTEADINLEVTKLKGAKSLVESLKKIPPGAEISALEKTF